ncbi:MAG TPA: hypothetical protein VMC86_00560 [Gemmatimonadales bacterium]|nr:hypothetical protein [Gemmatimonadales bacterium]
MPVTIERFVQELERLKRDMDGGLKHGEYDQRLARVLGDLREAKLDADRAKVSAALADLLQRGVITPGVKMHIEKVLGM